MLIRGLFFFKAFDNLFSENNTIFKEFVRIFSLRQGCCRISCFCVLRTAKLLKLPVKTCVCYPEEVESIANPDSSLVFSNEYTEVRGIPSLTSQMGPVPTAPTHLCTNPFCLSSVVLSFLCMKPWILLHKSPESQL